MKSLIIYYIATIVPIVALVLLTRADILTSGQFVFGLLFYSLVYRTGTDGYRLFGKGLLDKNEIWKFGMMRSVYYFKELYWL